MKSYITHLVTSQDGVICLVIALGLFAGATPMAVYASGTTSYPAVSSAAGATAVCFFVCFFGGVTGLLVLSCSPSLGLWLLLVYGCHCSGGVGHGGVFCAQVVHEGEVRRD